MLHIYTLFFSKIFIKCFKNSILLSRPKRFSVRPSYLFSLSQTTQIVYPIYFFSFDHCRHHHCFHYNPTLGRPNFARSWKTSVLSNSLPNQLDFLFNWNLHDCLIDPRKILCCVHIGGYTKLEED